MFQASLVSSSSRTVNGITISIREYTSRFGGTRFHAESEEYVRFSCGYARLLGQGDTADEAVENALHPMPAERLFI